ncbi:MAG: alanine--tRNA ligase [Candidatus Thermoplasmatota archaeon]|nr:alanine--tRNA ligase [Candidatus Thermoplasmatota archaeon]
MEKNNALTLDFFIGNDFERKKCPKCGSIFWTRDKKRVTCGEYPCDQYSFIGNSPCSKNYDVDGMRDLFISFFSDTHKVVKNYPVVPRWRDDVLLVNASIYDFQPHVTMGYAKPPGNPIVMSQPCVRMTDLDEVGRSLRHTTGFEMMCHDAFNYPGNRVYWKEETTEYCDRFLTEALGVDRMRITYKENPWAGGGNAGNAIEVIVDGLEVATLVFMDLVEDPQGSIEMDGIKYSKMPLEVVDTGYGLERLSWLSKGSANVLEAVYPAILSFLRSRMGGEEESPETQRELSILADHSRTILFLLSDSVIPSNVKVGYLARLLIRRSFRSIDASGVKCSVMDLIREQLKAYGKILPGYSDSFAESIIKAEEEKYVSSVANGTAAVERIFRKKKSISPDDLVTLYDSNGLPPDLVKSLLEEKFHYTVKIPEDFHKRVVSLHAISKKEKPAKIGFPAIETRPLYYDDTSIKDFTAIVLASGDGFVILNQTAFYPEGGGQPCDLGYLRVGNRDIEVTSVQKIGKAIFHYVKETIPEKSRVHGYIDYGRRRQLMIHHSATHLILGVMRELLGNHVWQSGVQKEVDYSRIDITHFSKLSREDIERIEARCLEIIGQDRIIKVMNLEWNKGLEKYGFRLFQGGVPLSDKIRIVEIDGIDVEGCGGTHLSHTSDMNMVKIVSTESIQEGIQRVIFVAGPAALRNFRNTLEISKQIQDIVHSRVDDMPGRIMSIIEGSAQQKRESAVLKNKLLDSYFNGSGSHRIGEISVYVNESVLPEEVEDLFIPRVLGMKNSVGIARTESKDLLVVSSVSTAKEICKKIADGKNTNVTGTDRVARVALSDIPTEKIISRISD